MNGETLPIAHGYPVRVIVPGYIGARSVKWLSNINIQDLPSENYFQQLAYKLFPRSITEKDADWSKGIMLNELNITSLIFSHHENDKVVKGICHFHGIAYSGGGHTIERVDFSIDGGTNWLSAKLGSEIEKFAWRFWQIKVTLQQEGKVQLAVRAIDSACNTQPASIYDTWNWKGYMNNAYHRVNIIVLPSPAKL